jgi:hypothetical protein
MRRIIFLIIIAMMMSYNISFSQSNDDCLGCHEDMSLTMEKRGKTMKIGVKASDLKKSIHRKLKCVQCHVGFDPNEMPHKKVITPVNCKSCHDNTAKNHLFHPQMQKATGMEGSKDVNCKGCHGTHTVESTKDPKAKFFVSKLTDACGQCHQEERAEHLVSEHFQKSTEHDPNSPNCIYCHVQPVTKGFKLSPVQLKINREKLCLDCHLNEKTAKTQFSKSLIEYDNSVHGQALQRGVEEAPSCTDCHGVHNLQKANKSGSTINKFNVSHLCGKCHISITHEFDNSIHGISLKKGNHDAPSCTHCHGEHGIRPVEGLTDRVFTENHINKLTVVENQMVYCVDCHTNKKLSDKYGMQTIAKAHDWLPNIVEHHRTVRCVDCHSSYLPPNLSHNILPPQKTIKKCEECHSKNSVLMTKLYKHEREKSAEKFGWLNGAILSDAYVIGSTRNVFLDSLSIIILVIVAIVLGIHGLLRWYFTKGGH